MIRYSLADQFVDRQTGKTWNGIPPPNYVPKRRFVEEEMQGGKCSLPKNHPNLRRLSSPIDGTTTTGDVMSVLSVAHFQPGLASISKQKE
jgi:hypothetical protein